MIRTVATGVQHMETRDERLSHGNAAPTAPDARVRFAGRQPRHHLYDYTPGMLATRAAAWWQARHLAKAPEMRRAWAERLGGSREHMTRKQKVGAMAINAGAAVLLAATVGRASQAAGIDVGDLPIWSGTEGAGIAQPSPLETACTPTDPAPAPQPEHPAPPNELAALDLPATTATSLPDSVSEPKAAPASTIESDTVGAFTGKINPDTGYYFGTAYNTLAEELIEHGVNPKHDIPAGEYHTQVGHILAENDWTWESAQRSMQPNDTLTINRDVFEGYLPPPAPPPPEQPRPDPPVHGVPPPAAPPTGRQCPEAAIPWWYWLGIGGAALGGGAIGAFLASRFGKRRQQPAAPDQAADATRPLLPTDEQEPLRQNEPETSAAPPRLPAFNPILALPATPPEKSAEKPGAASEKDQAEQARTTPRPPDVPLYSEQSGQRRPTFNTYIPLPARPKDPNEKDDEDETEAKPGKNKGSKTPPVKTMKGKKPKKKRKRHPAKAGAARARIRLPQQSIDMTNMAFLQTHGMFIMWPHHPGGGTLPPEQS